MPVTVFFEGKHPPAVKAAGRLLAKAAALGLGRNAAKAVNLVFTDGPGIRALNRRFLSKNRLTDVIAFNFPPSRLPGANWGEIYVCVPVAARQAKAMGHALLTELLVLAAHGALHLSGMEDGTTALRRRMNERTAELLKKIR
ncbi:MAG TPA: rRNA maturation RNase YbeY [Elusimicrobia bacterium]|nr:rRNA maturation RNase YbeY [Elusimicrobiota bacterium]